MFLYLIFASFHSFTTFENLKLNLFTSQVDAVEHRVRVMSSEDGPGLGGVSLKLTSELSVV